MRLSSDWCKKHIHTYTKYKYVPICICIYTIHLFENTEKLYNKYKTVVSNKWITYTYIYIFVMGIWVCMFVCIKQRTTSLIFHYESINNSANFGRISLFKLKYWLSLFQCEMEVYERVYSFCMNFDQK